MIEHILILSLTSIGICATMWEDMIFFEFGEWIEKKVGVFWAKPLGKCYICSTLWISLCISGWCHWPWWYAITAMGLSAVISLLQHD